MSQLNIPTEVKTDFYYECTELFFAAEVMMSSFASFLFFFSYQYSMLSRFFSFIKHFINLWLNWISQYEMMV